MPDAVTETTPQSMRPPVPRSWVAPRLAELPKLTALTLASAIGGTGGTGSGGSTVFGFLLALGLAAGIMGCSATRDLTGPAEGEPGVNSARLYCRGDLATRTIDCSGPSAAAGNLIVGGQGVTVALRSSNVVYDNGTGILSADVTIQNLSPVTLASVNGTTKVGGIHIFFESGPIAAPAGTITLPNIDGSGNFTGTGQPFFFYDTLLKSGQVSLPKNWKFEFQGGATSFTFTVLVTALAPVQSGVLQWSAVGGMTSAFLNGVAGWGTSGLAVTSTKGQVFVREGGKWTARSDPTGFGPTIPYYSSIPAVAATGPNDLWSLTSDFLTSTSPIRRWDGYSWRSMDGLAGGPVQGDASRMGTDARGPYAIGQGLWHWNGLGWESDTLPGVGLFMSGATVVGGQILAVAYDGTVWLNDLHDWIPVGGAGSGQLGQIDFIVASDTNHIMVFKNGAPQVRYWNGTIWSTLTLPHSLAENYYPTAGVATGPNAFFVIAHDLGSFTGGYVWKWNGTSWSVDHSGGGRRYGAVWARNANEVYFVGEQGMVERRTSGGTWSYVLAPAAETREVAVIDDNNVFVGRNGGAVYRYNGSNWAFADSMPEQTVNSIWASGASDVWVASGGLTARHFDGTSWSTVDPLPGGYAVSGFGGSGPNDVWAVGAPGFIQHFDGVSWSEAVGPGALGFVSLQRVWAISPTFALATGNGGEIWRWNGFVWSVQPSPTTDPIAAFSGTSDSDIWAVVGSGAIWHWDGGGWSSIPSGTGESLYGIWARSADEVYAVGSNATMLVYNGSAWSPMQVQRHTGFDYTRIAGTSSGLAYVTGTSLLRGTVP